MHYNVIYVGRSWLLIGLLAIMEGCSGLVDPVTYNRGMVVYEYPTNAPDDKWLCYFSTFFDLNRQIPIKNIVIDSDSALLAYFDYARYGYNNLSSPCLNYQPEAIDFTKYTLLGNYQSGECNVAFTRIVERDDKNQRYSYTVILRESGTCKKLVASMNWVLVPKLPAGYTVTFLEM